ncbi:hypothetical protein [Agromyces sp. ZXT2-6]|uniref:hypothetical protein n=1 Tax=Agromyces sp. ZXT2-6 TaxID=3461153 RepID=UPI004054F49B
MSPSTWTTDAAASARRTARAFARAADRTPALAYAAAVVPVALVVVAVATQPWMPPTDLVRDSQAVAVLRGSANTVHGMVSNLGIVAMAAAAGAALLSAVATTHRGDRLPRVLAWGGGLTLAVALDDLLLLHEAATFAAWMPKLIVVAYAAAFGVYLWRFRVEILRHLDVGLLAIAMLALGTSALVDAFAEPATVASVLVEDGAKLLGFAAWSAFLIRGALIALRGGRASGSRHARSEAMSTRA